MTPRTLLFLPLEISLTTTSSLWKPLLCAAALLGGAARAQEAVSPIELVRQSRAQVAVTNLDYALSLAKAAVEADPAFADGWKQQGRVEMLRGKLAAAQSSFATVLTLRPDDADIPVWNLWLLLDAGYSREVASQLQAKSDADLLKLGDSMIARTFTALLTREFTEDAAALATRWGKTSTNEASRTASATLAQLARGETSAAAAALEKTGNSSSARDLLANAWLRVGRVRAKSGDATGAQSAFQQALAIWPGWNAAQKELEALTPRP